MRPIGVSKFCLIIFALAISSSMKAAPPFSGTIFLDPDIITADDPTAFTAVTEAGRGDRWMFDRRVNDWVYLNAFLFDATFDDGLTIEIQVNPEFGDTASALEEATKYAPVIGRLPSCLRADVETVWIHRGNMPFGGGNNNLLIHTGQADRYEGSGILEETLVHEASHTSLDAEHSSSPGWLSAQAMDGEFISTYARDNPIREDVAESFLLYLAVRHRSDRISQSLADTISQTIPHRISYFDDQDLNLYPLVAPKPIIIRSLSHIQEGWLLSWESRESRSYTVYMSTNLIDWTPLFSDVESQGSVTNLNIDTRIHRLPSVSTFFQIRERP
jgi:hypothetical protein